MVKIPCWWMWGWLYLWGTSALSADDVNRRATDAKTHVLKIFAGWAEPEASQPHPQQICRAPYLRSPAPDRWSKGRVTLLGDAAHPVVPSRTRCKYGVWGRLRTECLAVAPNIEALNAYENSRIPRTAIIYDRSATQGYKAYQPDSENTFTEMMKPSFRVRMTLHGFIAIIQFKAKSLLSVFNIRRTNNDRSHFCRDRRRFGATWNFAYWYDNLAKHCGQ